ncbi:MAG: glycerol kinase, partial [Solirubrobacterales bacterium]|nr:glycerol kinase [Solirubrobacterales bacterium]
MTTILAIDAGTTGVRSFAVDETGRPTASAYREFPQHFPRPGWVEHDPVDIWDATLATLTEVVDTIGRDGVGAIGITNQR